MMRSRLSVGVLLLAAGGCVDSNAPQASDGLLPASLLLVAEAHAVDANGRRIDCTVETFVTLNGRVDREAGRVIQYGEGGGDATRFRDVSADRSVHFWADTYFEHLEFHLIGVDSVEVRSPLSATATERFWREFAVWAGSSRPADPLPGELARGDWTCHPMDTPPESGEYYDAEGTATGTWRLLKG